MQWIHDCAVSFRISKQMPALVDAEFLARQRYAGDVPVGDDAVGDSRA